MKRIALTDGSNTWFDAERAESYEEATRWDGSNWISVATKSQWHHEHLYKTSGRKWILNTWSDYQRTPDEYTEILEEEAYDWLVQNQYYDAVPKEQLDARKVDHGKTMRRAIYVSDWLWDATKDAARANDMDVTEAVNELLGQYVRDWQRSHPPVDYGDDYDV